MNLWAKRIGQLAVMAVALFFLSCEDEAGLLGYKNPNTKFEVNYVEIPLESSVLLLDSQRTSNFLFPGGTAANETNRFLVGNYMDEQLGLVSATSFTQYFTTSGAKLPTGVVFDSISLELRLDYYNYGSQPTSSQTITIHELEDELSKGTGNYFNYTEVNYNSAVLGSKSISVDPKKIKDDLVILNDGNTTNDTLVTPLTIKMPLDPSFGQRLFENALAYSVNNDTTFVTDILFTKLFKGIAIKSNATDKIIGLTPSSTSGIKLHYHVPGPDAKQVTLVLGFASGFRTIGKTDAIGPIVAQYALTGFSQVKTDRSGTALASLTQFAQDFLPSNELRYIQCGAGVYTKLDFGKFFEFADTVPNLIINSAELVVTGVEQSDNAPFSTSLGLRILNDNNRVKKFRLTTTYKQDSIDFNRYNASQYSGYPGSITGDGGSFGEADNGFVVITDQGSGLGYSSDTRSFSGNYALFFQQLVVPEPNKTKFSSVILFPTSPGRPAGNKTVNRTIFPSSGIKLKIHYTKPTIPID
jgi:hypothetical protein